MSFSANEWLERKTRNLISFPKKTIMIKNNQSLLKRKKLGVLMLGGEGVENKDFSVFVVEFEARLF